MAATREDLEVAGALYRLKHENGEWWLFRWDGRFWGAQPASSKGRPWFESRAAALKAIPENGAPADDPAVDVFAGLFDDPPETAILSLTVDAADFQPDESDAFAGLDLGAHINDAMAHLRQ